METTYFIPTLAFVSMCVFICKQQERHNARSSGSEAEKGKARFFRTAFRLLHRRNHSEQQRSAEAGPTHPGLGPCDHGNQVALRTLGNTKAEKLTHFLNTNAGEGPRRAQRHMERFQATSPELKSLCCFLYGTGMWGFLSGS